MSDRKFFYCSYYLFYRATNVEKWRILFGKAMNMFGIQICIPNKKIFLRNGLEINYITYLIPCSLQSVC